MCLRNRGKKKHRAEESWTRDTKAREEKTREEKREREDLQMKKKIT